MHLLLYKTAFFTLTPLHAVNSFYKICFNVTSFIYLIKNTVIVAATWVLILPNLAIIILPIRIKFASYNTKFIYLNNPNISVR